MAKMPKKLETWLTPKIRGLSRYWPGKTIARENAKVKVQDGNFQNGKPKFVTKFKCAGCGDAFLREETHMDHRVPVVGPEGFTNWENYITRLFCDPSNFDCLCVLCHGFKTKAEGEERTETRKKVKKST